MKVTNSYSAQVFPSIFNCGDLYCNCGHLSSRPGQDAKQRPLWVKKHPFCKGPLKKVRGSLGILWTWLQLKRQIRRFITGNFYFSRASWVGCCRIWSDFHKLKHGELWKKHPQGDHCISAGMHSYYPLLKLTARPWKDAGPPKGFSSSNQGFCC